jgi:hypothetical protein
VGPPGHHRARGGVGPEILKHLIEFDKKRRAWKAERASRPIRANAKLPPEVEGRLRELVRRTRPLPPR